MLFGGKHENRKTESRGGEHFNEDALSRIDAGCEARTVAVLGTDMLSEENRPTWKQLFRV
jgi:hypothetical protein